MGVIMYILLSGRPPFYSNNGANWSDDMQERIRAGEYRFDEPYWNGVSEEAKVTIQRMLTVDPTQRITIGEIRNCSWLTELTSERPIDISLLRDEENLNQIQVSYYYSLTCKPKHMYNYVLFFFILQNECEYSLIYVRNKCIFNSI